MIRRTTRTLSVHNGLSRVRVDTSLRSLMSFSRLVMNDGKKILCSSRRNVNRFVVTFLRFDWSLRPSPWSFIRLDVVLFNTRLRANRFFPRPTSITTTWHSDRVAVIGSSMHYYDTRRYLYPRPPNSIQWPMVTSDGKMLKLTRHNRVRSLIIDWGLSLDKNSVLITCIISLLITAVVKNFLMSCICRRRSNIIIIIIIFMYTLIARYLIFLDNWLDL